MSDQLTIIADLLRAIREDIAAPPSPVPMLLSADQVAATLGLSRSAVYRLASGPDFPAAVMVDGVGKRWRRGDVEKWADRLRPGRRRRGVPGA